jgi:hypothetical protein
MTHRGITASMPSSGTGIGESCSISTRVGHWSFRLQPPHLGGSTSIAILKTIQIPIKMKFLVGTDITLRQFFSTRDNRNLRNAVPLVMRISMHYRVASPLDCRPARSYLCVTRRNENGQRGHKTEQRQETEARGAARKLALRTLKEAQVQLVRCNL